MDEKIIEFTAYLMESYRRIKNMSGKEVAAFFESNKLYDFVKRQYDFLHIESPEANAKTIDEFVTPKAQIFYHDIGDYLTREKKIFQL